jgi:hypothetical protein
MQSADLLDYRRAAALFVLVLAAACRHIPERPGRHVEVLSTPNAQPLTLVDIAVMPVENLTGEADLPLEDMRAEFQAGLVRLRYSPLSLAYVDRSLADATYTKGSLREEGIFQVTLHAWDETSLRAHGVVQVDCEARLIDPYLPETEAALWHGHLARPIQLGSDRSIHSIARLRKEALVAMVEELLGAVPPRIPQSAPSPSQKPQATP